MNDKEIKKAVREGYAQVAKQEASCCGPANSCCGTATSTQEIGKTIGYSDWELESVPDGANLGLGCGNPIALASLKAGETVLDLGSGAGFDAFLAAEKIGKTGKVIGVDMTPEMLEKARKNASKGDYTNVEFRLGEIEKLPVDDNSVDVIISNCVINLSPDKDAVFNEAYRVLKPGGRLMVSDIVLEKELPDFLRDSTAAYIGCISGAILRGGYIDAIKEAGFRDVEIVDETKVPAEAWLSNPIAESVIKELKVPVKKVNEILGSVTSIKVHGVKLRL